MSKPAPMFAASCPQGQSGCGDVFGDPICPCLACQAARARHLQMIMSMVDSDDALRVAPPRRSLMARGPAWAHQLAALMRRVQRRVPARDLIIGALLFAFGSFILLLGVLL